MSEIKWIKITTNMFEDEKIKLIDAMPEKDTIHSIWIRLLVQAGKTNANGYIFLNENIPYTDEMLSTIFIRPLNSIRLALKTLSDFKMIEIEENNLIKISNWDKHQNVQGMDRIREQTRKRVSNYRNKQKDEDEDKPIPKECNVTECESNVTVTKQRERKKENKEIEKDKELELERDKEEQIEMEVLEGKEEAEIISQAGFRVLSFYERITGILGVFSLGALNIAIAQHGEKYVRMAIDKSLAINKVNMTYINGILKNWRKEGYPKEEVENNNGKCMSSNGNEFEGFKPNKSRELSAKERCSSESKLI